MTDQPDTERRQRIATAILRYDNEHALSSRAVPSEHHYGEADAVIAADQAHDAEVRAAALLEAADDLEAIDFHPNAKGSYSGAAKAFAVRLRRMAAAARPEGIQGARP